MSPLYPSWMREQVESTSKLCLSATPPRKAAFGMCLRMTSYSGEVPMHVGFVMSQNDSAPSPIFVGSGGGPPLRKSQCASKYSVKCGGEKYACVNGGFADSSRWAR